MAKELIWHVDENDNPIGSVERDESRRVGARYRIARVMVESEDGMRVLLQKRLATKKTYPGCWDTSAGGNIDYGESYEDAAKRELFEEIGLRASSLAEVAYFYSESVDPEGGKMNRFTRVFLTSVDQDFAFTPQETEVELVKWIEKTDLPAVIAEGAVTDGLLQVYERYYEKQ